MKFQPFLFPLRRLSSLFVTSVLVASAFSSTAAADTKGNVVENIQAESNGNITIDIPKNILDLILQPVHKKDSQHEIKAGINKLAGYRIQVFSDGRNQSTLEARAKARGSAILAKFPKYKGQVYTYSSSPNWYTRVGNFRTSAEANTALTELKRAFPNFASEIRIVRCQIVVVKQ